MRSKYHAVAHVSVILGCILMKKNIWHILFALIISACVTVPSMAADCNSLKKALKNERNLKQKRKLLSNLIIQCPDDPQVNYKYALSLERFRKYDKALGYYQKAVLLSPQMGKAFAGMGDVYIYLGLLNEAIEAYSSAARLMPQSDRTASRLARLEIKKKALTGGIVSVGEFVQVMDHRGKISSNMPLLLTGPALQYNVAFVHNTAQLRPTGIRQLAAIGQAMQDDALKFVRFEISTFVDESYATPLVALEESKKRVTMIKDQLVANFLIAPERITVSWYGDNQPLESGSLSGARSLNSRVEFRRLFE
jgi:tetratricopeptide (TPR) repeat protein